MGKFQTVPHIFPVTREFAGEDVGAAPRRPAFMAGPIKAPRVMAELRWKSRGRQLQGNARSVLTDSASRHGASNYAGPVAPGKAANENVGSVEKGNPFIEDLGLKDLRDGPKLTFWNAAPVFLLLLVGLALVPLWLWALIHLMWTSVQRWF